MKLLNRGLSKLTITGWKDREGKVEAGRLQADFNPETLQLDYNNSYETTDALNSKTQSSRYVRSAPSGLSLTLLFDGQIAGQKHSVEQQLTLLKTLCGQDAATESPYFLKLSWGKLRWGSCGYFAGRASGLSVNYTLFDRDATPLRATATLTLVADQSVVLQDAARDLKAPSRKILSVPALATLPLMAANAVGNMHDSVDYLSLAWQNGLDSLDDFRPGDLLQVHDREPV